LTPDPRPKRKRGVAHMLIEGGEDGPALPQEKRFYSSSEAMRKGKGTLDFQSHKGEGVEPSVSRAHQAREGRGEPEWRKGGGTWSPNSLPCPGGRGESGRQSPNLDPKKGKADWG